MPESFIVSILAGIVVGLLATALRMLWTQVLDTASKNSANAAEIAALREKIESVADSVERLARDA